MDDSYISLYNDDFFKGRPEYCRDYQKDFGYLLGIHLNIKSVIDFGCSIGSFLEGFKDAGVKIKGFEVAFAFSKKYTPENLLPFIELGDVTQPIKCVPVDCSFSIEVAEHIKPEGSLQFITNLCNNSLKYVLLSAAPVGQEGIGHINCQPFSYWIVLFKRFGFNYLKEETAQIKQLSLQVKNMRPWITKNIMLFKKGS